MNRFSLYVPGNSAIHRLDPRTKLAWAALVFVLALVFNDPRYLAVVFGVVLVAAILAGRPALQLLGFAYALIPIVLLTIVLWPLFERSGTPLFQLGSLPITDNGLMFAVAMGERLLVPILAVLLLFITTRRREIVAGLVKIGLPYQVGFGVTIAFGFLPILAGTGQTIIEAQRARALEINKGSIFARLRKSVSLIVPLAINAISSIQKLAYSMESRAYGANPTRTYLHELRFTGLDRALLLAAAVALVASFALRFTGHGAILASRL